MTASTEEVQMQQVDALSSTLITSDAMMIPKSCDESTNMTKRTESTSIEEDINNHDTTTIDTTTATFSANQNLNKKWYCSIKLYIGLLLLGIIVYIIIDSATNQYVRDGLVSFLDWTEENPTSGFFLFVVVYIVATLLFIPGSILTLGAGFVFSMALHGLGLGVLVGSLSVFIGASIGAILSFLLGRYLLLEQVHKLSKKYAIFEALNEALKTNGLKIFILLRLSPIIPFGALNYLAGALSVSMRDYILSLFAIIPGTVLYVFLGASAGSLADSSNSGSSNMTVTIVIVLVGIILGVLAIALTTRYAKKELNRIIEERSNNNNDDTAIADTPDAVNTTPETRAQGTKDDFDDIEAPLERITDNNN